MAVKFIHALRRPNLHILTPLIVTSTLHDRTHLLIHMTPLKLKIYNLSKTKPQVFIYIAFNAF